MQPSVSIMKPRKSEGLAFLRQCHGAAERLHRLRRPALMDRAAELVQRVGLLDRFFQDGEEIGRFSQRGFGFNQTALAIIPAAGAG